ncbi:MAG: hypothetical protein ABI910_05005 [Gemmatimonadota bacterium]
MTHRSTLALTLPLLLLTATPATRSLAASSAPVVVGPPWISIEYPVNPYDAATRGAYLVVHAFHHGTPTGLPVTGTAEGIVNGARRSVALTFAATSRPGVFTLAQQWPNDGTWTLLVSVVQGPDDNVTAVVDLTPTGEVAMVRVPTRRKDGYTLPAAVTMSTIDASLERRAAQQSAAR